MQTFPFLRRSFSFPPSWLSFQKSLFHLWGWLRSLGPRFLRLCRTLYSRVGSREEFAVSCGGYLLYGETAVSWDWIRYFSGDCELIFEGFVIIVAPIPWGGWLFWVSTFFLFLWKYFPLFSLVFYPTFDSSRARIVYFVILLLCFFFFFFVLVLTLLKFLLKFILLRLVVFLARRVRSGWGRGGLSSLFLASPTMETSTSFCRLFSELLLLMVLLDR